MNNLITKLAMTLMVSLLFSVGMVAQATEKLAESWVMTPKEGKSDDFRKALKEHVAHRVTLQDPRKWKIYTPVLGDKLDRFIIRACCFEWKDQDQYMAWNKEKNPMQHWQKKADKLVHSYAHHLSTVDSENSHWPADLSYSYVGVTNMQVKAGHWSAMKADLATMSSIAKTHNWPYHWGWTYSVGGPRSVSLVIPYNNYADMAPPEQKFSELLVKHFGDKDKAQAFMQGWSDHFDTNEYQIYRLNTELSMM
ncbi:hypothetical protein [Lacimicrobium sp. SS2-24]|uniref:hypothetical protein n=1 Tax=Lacimicrobium sp. SS2-24 TaxID=2005569 RepID=UPI000B4A6A21|nr:hypothetical protein [Lacimicrobium sp. SS2-24]